MVEGERAASTKTNRRKFDLSEAFKPNQRHQLLGLLFGADVPSVLEGQMLRTSDVATLFEVSERTVSEWAKTGRIPSVRTPGGHRRYPAEGIRVLIEAGRRASGESRGQGQIPRPSPAPEASGARRPVQVVDCRRSGASPQAQSGRLAAASG